MQIAAEHARREIGNALYKAILAQPAPARASVIFRALPADLEATPASARDVLQSDPRFVEQDGRFDIAVRDQIAAMGFNAALEHLIEDLGAPINPSLAAAFFATVTDRDQGYYEQLVERLAQRGNAFLQAQDGLVPGSWLLFPEGDTDEDVLFYCDLETDEELAFFRPFLADDDLRAAAPLDTAVKMVKAAGEPIRNKVLDFFVWRLHPGEFDGPQLLSQMLQDDRVYSAAGLRWLPGEVGEQVRVELHNVRESAGDHEGVAELDLPAILAEPLPPDRAGYFIEDDDLGLIYDMIKKAPEPVTVQQIMFEVLELFPEDEEFIPALHSVHALLHDDPGLLDLDVTTFMGPGALPAWVKAVPPELVPHVDPIDVAPVLQAEGLDPGLQEKLQDPYLEDYADDEIPVPDDMITEDETFYTVSFPHIIAGTMKLRKMDREFFGVLASAAPITVLDAEGAHHEAWVNTETGLIVGLGKLYETMDLKPGALLGLTRGDGEREFFCEYGGEDEVSAIPPERLGELLGLRQQAEKEDWTLFQALCETLRAYPKGAQFEIIYSQLNVVYRATRLQLASLLSYYLCFRAGDDQGDTWIFSPRAINAGVVQSKQKFIIPDWGVSD